jgi:hypothetical protein
MKTTQYRLGFVAIVASLAACGGGGGGSSSTATSTAGGSTTPAAVTKFADISVPAGFTWKTVTDASAVSVSLNRTSAAALGNVRVVVSNFIETDPTGSGAAIEPMSTDVIGTALASNAAGTSATAAFGTLRFPAGTTFVLVEVFDVGGGARLASGKVAVATLASAGLALTL